MIPHSLTRAPIVDRDSFLTETAKGRTVLHLGCADAPYFRLRAADGTLLHTRLAAVANRVVGIDNDEEGVRFLKDEMGFKDIILADVETLPQMSDGCSFNLVVAGELLEHLSNPGLCLRRLRLLIDRDGILVITVPNAFSLKTFLRVGCGVELVHPDHVSYYSIVTIKKLLSRYGFYVTSHAFYVSNPSSKFKRLGDRLLLNPVRRIAPYFSDGIIVKARIFE